MVKGARGGRRSRKGRRGRVKGGGEGGACVGKRGQRAGALGQGARVLRCGGAGARGRALAGGGIPNNNHPSTTRVNNQESGKFNGTTTGTALGRHQPQPTINNHHPPTTTRLNNGNKVHSMNQPNQRHQRRFCNNVSNV